MQGELQLIIIYVTSLKGKSKKKHVTVIFS